MQEQHRNMITRARHILPHERIDAEIKAEIKAAEEKERVRAEDRKKWLTLFTAAVIWFSVLFYHLYKNYFSTNAIKQAEYTYTIDEIMENDYPALEDFYNRETDY